MRTSSSHSTSKADRLRGLVGAGLLAALCGLPACGGGGSSGRDETAAEAIPSSSTSAASDRDLDVAIAGAGAFILQDPATGERLYSRLGRFDLDAEGRLINGEGWWVEGAAAEPVDEASAPVVQPLPAVARVMPAARSTRVSLTANLDARVSAVEPSDFDPGDAKTYNFATSMALYDDNGKLIFLTMYLRCVDQGWGSSSMDRWEMWFMANGVMLPWPPIDLRFSPSGIYFDDMPEGYLFDLPAVPSADGSMTEPLPGLRLMLQGLSNYGAQFSVYESSVDGYVAGRLTAARLDADGHLALEYDNGQQRSGGSLLLAKFTVADRLVRRGDSGWVCGELCEPPVTGPPGTQLLGALLPRALNTDY